MVGVDGQPENAARHEWAVAIQARLRYAAIAVVRGEMDVDHA
jgi:hypothetical protein